LYKPVVVAASTSSKRALGYRHLVEPITTVITDALARATEDFTTGAPSSRAGSYEGHRPDLLVSGSHRVDQRCRLASRSCV
jgi:hypothetical protein